MAANSFGGLGNGSQAQSTPTVPRTPIPTGTPGVTVTPVDAARVLERDYCEMNFSNIVPDQQRFIADPQYALNQLKPKIEQQGFLQKRRVGLAIAFGGAPDGTEDSGVNVASQVYSVLGTLGKDVRSAFHNASYFDPLFTNKYNTTTVVIDVYLVELSGQTGTSCPGHIPPTG